MGIKNRDEVIAALAAFAANNGQDRLTIKQWISVYWNETNEALNYETVRKRRLVSGIGKLEPPRVYTLTAAEFVAVLETPLPMCGVA